MLRTLQFGSEISVSKRGFNLQKYKVNISDNEKIFVFSCTGVHKLLMMPVQNTASEGSGFHICNYCHKSDEWNE